MTYAADAKPATSPTLPRPVVAALRRLLRLVPRAPAEIAALNTPEFEGEADRAAVLTQITGWLYRDWYTALPNPESSLPLFPGREDLTTALRTTVAGVARWEEGWVVMQADATGICVAGKKQMQRTLLPGEYVNLVRPGAPVAPGDHVAVPQAVTWRDDATGFWCAQSHASAPTAPLVRVYFNVHPENVGFVLRAATTVLDDLGACYSLKCPAFAAAYQRVDTLIFYLEASAWQKARDAVAAVARAQRSHLRRAVPPLTQRIALGAAFAEHPTTGGSFGETRCRALAPAICSLLQNSGKGTALDLSKLVRALVAAGIDPAHPWLTGSSDGTTPVAAAPVP